MLTRADYTLLAVEYGREFTGFARRTPDEERPHQFTFELNEVGAVEMNYKRFSYAAESWNKKPIQLLSDVPPASPPVQQPVVRTGNTAPTGSLMRGCTGGPYIFFVVRTFHGGSLGGAWRGARSVMVTLRKCLYLRVIAHIRRAEARDRAFRRPPRHAAALRQRAAPSPHLR